MAETSLQHVPAALVPKCWPDVLPFIERALDYDGGRRGPEDILEKLLTSHMQLWLSVGEGIEAVLVTEIVKYPRQRRLSLTLSAGNVLQACTDHLPEIEAIARGRGCDFIEAAGRAGWEKVLPGFRRSCVLLEKRL